MLSELKFERFPGFLCFDYGTTVRHSDVAVRSVESVQELEGEIGDSGYVWVERA